MENLTLLSDRSDANHVGNRRRRSAFERRVSTNFNSLRKPKADLGKLIKINISGLDFKTWSSTIDQYPDYMDNKFVLLIYDILIYFFGQNRKFGRKSVFCQKK